MYSGDPRDRRGHDQRGAYDQGAYGQGAYSQDNATRAYERDPYASAPYQDAYRDDPYRGDPYGRDAYPQAQGSKRGPSRQGPRINAGLFVGGVVATAVVTALAAWLVAWIIRVVSQRITETGKLGVWNPVAQDEYWFAVVGVLCALLGGALWYVLQITTPSPDQFYMWIVGLLTVAAVVLPLLLSREIATGIGTAILHLVIGLPVMFLIAAMGSKSVEA